MDITKVNIEQLPSGEIQLTSKVMFGIDEFLHTDTVQNLLDLLGVSTTNVKPRLVDLDITVLEANLNTFLNTVNITIAQGEIIFLRFFVIKSNGLLYRVTYTIPLTQGVYVPIGGFVDFDELILINTEYLGVEADANTITRSFNNLGEINTADPAIDFSDDTKVYIVILDSLPYLFEGALGFYGDGELQMELTDLTPLISPIGVETVSGNIVDNTDPANPIVNTPTLQEVTDEGNITNKSLKLDRADSSNAMYEIVFGESKQGAVYAQDGFLAFKTINEETNEYADGFFLYGSGGNNYILPSSGGLLKISDIKFGNFTASNGIDYGTIGNLTVSDPPDVDGFYTVFVLNGTTTIGGVDYTSGNLIYRFYQGGAWSSTVFGVSAPINTATQTALDKMETFIHSKANGTFGSHTGDTAETVLLSIDIDANEFEVGDWMSTFYLLTKTTLASATLRLRAGTTGTTGDSIQAIYIIPQTTTHVPFSRNTFQFLTGNLLEGLRNNLSALNDSANTAGVARTQQSITPSSDWKLTLTIANGDNAEVTTLLGYKIGRVKTQ